MCGALLPFCCHLLVGRSVSSMRQSLQIKALEEDGDVQALDADGKPVNPGTVQSYLSRAFKSRLPDAERALKVSLLQLCDSLSIFDHHRAVWGASKRGSGYSMGCCMDQVVVVS